MSRLSIRIVSKHSPQPPVKKTMSNVLVISPHPDDESIGCGGTLRRHVLQGDIVQAVFLTSGERGGHGRSREDTMRIREQEAREAAAILGLAQIEFWRVSNGSL